jgi:hypothetical protein
VEGLRRGVFKLPLTAQDTVQACSHALCSELKVVLLISQLLELIEQAIVYMKGGMHCEKDKEEDRMDASCLLLPESFITPDAISVISWVANAI